MKFLKKILGGGRASKSAANTAPQIARELESVVAEAERLVRRALELDYARTMRWVVPGVTLAALGFQTILNGWFVSILGMRRR